MRRLEHLRILHADRGELVDVEEPPVVDLVRRGSPVGHAVRLLLEEGVQQVEALRLTGPAVECGHGGGDVLADPVRVRLQAYIGILSRFLLSIANWNCTLVQSGARWTPRHCASTRSRAVNLDGPFAGMGLNGGNIKGENNPFRAPGNFFS